MKIKSINSKVGKFHYIKVVRVLSDPKGKFRKESIQLILTDLEARNLNKMLNKRFGLCNKEHLLAVSVTKKVVEEVKETKTEEIPLIFGMIEGSYG